MFTSCKIVADYSPLSSYCLEEVKCLEHKYECAECCEFTRYPLYYTSESYSTDSETSSAASAAIYLPAESAIEPNS